jgi:DNA-directed RNA polymerase subunit RPC12/RpoP
LKYFPCPKCGAGAYGRENTKRIKCSLCSNVIVILDTPKPVKKIKPEIEHETFMLDLED